MDSEIKYFTYFKEHCVEDQEEVLTILKAAAQDIYEKFEIRFGTKTEAGNVEWRPEMLGTVFAAFYEETINLLEQKTVSKSQFVITIADRLQIGFSNDDSEDMQIEGVDNEKIGNFCPFAKHIEKKHSIATSEYGTDPNARCNEWINANVTVDPKEINDISAATKQKLKSLGLKLMHPSYACPSFICVYEQLINFVKLRRIELDAFQYEINFLNCFYVKCIETDDGDEIRLRPNISNKLQLKDNLKASSKYDA